MTDDGPPTEPWIAVIGDRLAGFVPQDSIVTALEHSAAHLGVARPQLRWFGTEQLDAEGTEALGGASAAWCAPGGPFASMTGALTGIRWAREANVPFLGTCAGFQLGVVEFARNVLGRASATHAEYAQKEGPDPGDDEAELFIDELLCSLVGQTMQVEIVDDELASMYGTTTPVEQYYCRFGLHPDWRAPLHDAGLRVAGVDASDGDTRIMRLAAHPFHVLTLFVPQASSTASRPHPLVTGYLQAALLPAR